MIFEQIAVGGDRNFAYLVGDDETRRAAVVDPAFNPELVLERASAHGLDIVYLLNTHAHYDHAGGNEVVLARTAAEWVMRPRSQDEPPAPRTLSLGRLTLELLPTPGHTPDSVCIHVQEPGSPGKLITGDTLFVGKVGGTDYEAGARAEYDSLHRVLLALPDETEVWPGHDVGVRPHSTIGDERRTNPFLLRKSFEEFVELKRGWLAYKKAHGIA